MANRSTSGFSFLLYAAPRWIFLNFPVFVGWSGFYLALDTTRRLRIQERQLYNSIMLAQESQLKMLRFQLNPHFLFNTLNAISTLLLDKRNDEADMMLTRLSRFLRFTLDVAPDDQLPLNQELDAQRLYLDIEATRFGDRLQVDIHDGPPGRDGAGADAHSPAGSGKCREIRRSREPANPCAIEVRAALSAPGPAADLRCGIPVEAMARCRPSGAGVGLGEYPVAAGRPLRTPGQPGRQGPTGEGGFEVVMDLPMETIRKSGED